MYWISFPFAQYWKICWVQKINFFKFKTFILLLLQLPLDTAASEATSLTPPPIVAMPLSLKADICTWDLISMELEHVHSTSF
jgi:hypothetical protein